MAKTTDEHLHRMVLGIVKDLEAAVSGNLYKTENGDYLIIDDLDEWKEKRYQKKAEKFRKEHHPEDFEEDKDENGSEYGSYDEWMEYEIGTVEDIEEPEEVSLPDYIDDQSLGDIRVEVSLPSLEFNGGKVLFAYGGPNIWVADDEVRGYWGASHVEMSLDSDTRSALYSWFEELWNATKG